MKTTGMFAAAAALFAGANAQNYYSEFSISNFEATTNNYYFNVALAPDYSTTCSYTISSDYDYLPGVPYTTCADSNVGFEVTRPSQSGPAALYVYSDYNQADAVQAEYSIPSNQIVYNNYGNTITQVYTGPTTFNVQVNN